MNFNLLNPNCQKSILISEDFCLDKSFDIIRTNFEVFTKELNLSNEQYKRFEILKQRYETNKDKYRKILTFVSQFSASLEDVQRTYNFYKNIWEANTTPIEVIYPVITPVEQWGTFNEKTGVLSENVTTSTQTIQLIERWLNSNYSTSNFGLYKKIIVKIYLNKNIPDTFSYDASFVEDCECQGGTHQVCCTQPCSHGGHRGCNRMPRGPKCGNMYTLCPNGVLVNGGCQKTSCQGWGAGFNRQTWRNKTLSIKRSINSVPNNYIIGFSKITFAVNNQQWKRE